MVGTISRYITLRRPPPPNCRVTHGIDTCTNSRRYVFPTLLVVHVNSNAMQARVVCPTVKPRIRELASKEGLVGLLAVEIFLVLYDPNDSGRHHDF